MRVVLRGCRIGRRVSRLWDRGHDEHVAAAAATVAAELGLSLNSVLLAKSRVLKRLRQELAGLIE
jgi:hypothetical protein